LITVEGASAAESTAQTDRLADWLTAQGYPATRADPVARVGAGLTGARARALATAAAYADLVDREVRPALRAGRVVLVDRFLASPLGHAGLHADELEGL